MRDMGPILAELKSLKEEIEQKDLKIAEQDLHIALLNGDVQMWQNNHREVLAIRDAKIESLQGKLDAKITFINNGWEEERYALQESEMESRKLLQQSRKAMIAALKHLDGTAKLFSHRTKIAVLQQLSEALKPLNYPLPDAVEN